MPKYEVDYWMRVYNGSVVVDADTAEEAREKVEEMDREILSQHAPDSHVEVEQVARIEIEKAAS